MAETKPNLVHEAFIALLARFAKYSDPLNLEWEWKDADKYERHAINAALDLKDARAEIARLNAYIKDLDHDVQVAVNEANWPR